MGIVGITCAFTPGTTPKVATLTVTNTATLSSLTSVNLKLKLLSNKTLADPITFTVAVKIGNSSDGTNSWLWGNQLDNADIVTWENCIGGSVDKTGTAPVTNNFFLGSAVTLESISKSVPSSLEIEFGPGAGRT